MRFVQLSEQGKTENPVTPILRAVEQIKNLDPEVILLYSNKQNIELMLRQVKVTVVDHSLCYMLVIILEDLCLLVQPY